MALGRTGMELFHPYNISHMPKHHPDSRWELRSSIVAQWCLASSGGMGPQVGDTTCLEVQEWNHTTQMWEYWPNQTIDFWSDFSLENITAAPPGVHWICGIIAYSTLPMGWRGACTLGIVNPAFFMLPLDQPQVLEGEHRQGRQLKADFRIGDWKDEEWPPERVIQYYQPATWAQDGMYGYRTPIYMLNRIIRLQAVVEIIANETASALRTLAQQQRKFRDAIYQNRLALDYLLAAEGGVCAKFNFSNCCLQFDDIGEIIEQSATRIETVAHVPVHHWKGFEVGELFGTWFPKLPGLQAIVVLIGMIAAGCVIPPCILPIFVCTLSSSLSMLVDKKAAVQVMALREYESLLKAEEQPLIYIETEPTYESTQ